MVLLTAKEYNREDDEDDTGVVKLTEKEAGNNVDFDKEEEKKMTNNMEKGASMLEVEVRNIETAWNDNENSTVGRKKLCCMSWYRIFHLIGENSESDAIRFIHVFLFSEKRVFPIAVLTVFGAYMVIAMYNYFMT